MKLIHLADLHLGKRVNDFSMLGEQEYILLKILGIIDEEKPDGVIIAGDVYDKSVPSAEAVRLFDDFLNRLVKRGTEVFVISGNHDSPERIAFGAKLLDRSGVHMSRVYDGTSEPFRLTDEYGQVNVYLLPFLKPIAVRRFFEDEEIESYTDAVKAAVQHMNVNEAERNVLAAHQFVTGASVSDSEEISVGGSDNVDASAFDGFDYVALGHLHGPQKCGRETVRYAGSPLKYSFSEVSHRKSVTVIELGGKGEVAVRAVPLIPKHDMRELRGSYDELTLRENYEGTPTDDYLRVVLTDEDAIPNAVGLLRVIYPNIMELKYDNRRTRGIAELSGRDPDARRTPEELFAAFYEGMNGQPMTAEQTAYIGKLIGEIREEDV